MKKKAILSTPHQTQKETGLRYLLSTSQKSHFNTFVGYSRIPHKYDHFHDKTYVQNDLMQIRGLSHRPRQLNYSYLEEFLNTVKVDGKKALSRSIRGPLPKVHL